LVTGGAGILGAALARRLDAIIDDFLAQK